MFGLDQLTPEEVCPLLPSTAPSTRFHKWVCKDSTLFGSVRNSIWDNTWCWCICPCFVSLIGWLYNWTGSLLICNLNQRKEEAKNQPPVLSPIVFITRAWQSLIYRGEHGLTKHLLDKNKCFQVTPGTGFTLRSIWFQLNAIGSSRPQPATRSKNTMATGRGAPCQKELCRHS